MGEPVPASFASKTTQGFTGHESDDELGLVNMKGRIYDPRIGRSLTIDPIVSLPFFGQSWNPYSYVLNNPLAYVDPGGFQEAPPEDGARPPPPPGAELSWEVHDLAPLGLDLRVVPSPKHEALPDTNTVAAETGGAVPPIDVSTTGSASGHVPQPVTTAPIDWSQNPYVQVEGGFIAGLLLGAVPFAGVGHGLLDATGVLPHGTPEARMGLAIGQIVGGLALTIGGLTGEVFGGITSATGVGAAIGVPAIVVSTGLVVGGVGNIAAGIQGLSQALMSQGSGSKGPQRGSAVATGVTPRGGTYVLRDPATGKVMRTGRTNDLARRAREHGGDPTLRDLTFEPVHRTDVYAEQRGLEQMLQQTYQPPLNRIRPISPQNPRLQEYLDAARLFLERQ
ncbi:RHS repeat-associated core domain-containing protein [Sorangium sp. So ce1024]|uniref:RHS repeat-associated core domain-containing protein n=1 Tax=unclassified Sorangium TaxID=2621164 RepID=UPI003F0CFF9C